MPQRSDEEMRALAEKANWYLEGGWGRDNGSDEVIPTSSGLANFLEVPRRTVRRWAERGGPYEKPGFPEIQDRLMSMQEVALINNGLTGVFTPTITKLVLAHHGYSDKIDTNHTSSDKSMSPTTVILKAAVPKKKGKK